VRAEEGGEARVGALDAVLACTGHRFNHCETWQNMTRRSNSLWLFWLVRLVVADLVEHLFVRSLVEPQTSVSASTCTTACKQI
jgi:hypothetical protein